MTTATRTPRRPPMDARIRQRRIEVRRAGTRRRRRAVGSVVLLVALGAGAVGITRSPLFEITGVRVEGVQGPKAALVKDTAQIARGQNLMSADLDDALARAEALPWVAAAEIRRVPPSTVVIEVTPRTAVAILVGPSGSWLVDRGGVVIAEAASQPLPRIDLSSGVVPVPGSTIADPAARNALGLYASLPRDLRRALLTIEAVGPRTVRVHVALDQFVPRAYRKGRTTWVRMGAADDVGEQVVVLRALLEQLRRSDSGVPAEIDVRVPGNPVVVP
jgi:cell division septal protein FtsQ